MYTKKCTQNCIDESGSDAALVQLNISSQPFPLERGSATGLSHFSSRCTYGEFKRRKTHGIGELFKESC